MRQHFTYWGTPLLIAETTLCSTLSSTIIFFCIHAMAPIQTFFPIFLVPLSPSLFHHKFLSLHSFPAILKLSFFHPQDFVCSLSRIVLRESFCVDGAAEKMGLQNIPPFYSQNGSIEELFIGLNFGSAEATIMNPSRRSPQSLNQQLRQVFPCLEPSGVSSRSSCPGTASRSARPCGSRLELRSSAKAGIGV
jgi:hypothetical protein